MKQNKFLGAESWLGRHGIVVLLLLGCLLLSLLNIQQNRTIRSQRDLIHSLYRDSLELNAMKLQRLNTDRSR